MTDAPDWLALAARFNDVTARMIHDEHVDIHGNAFYAEALKRVFDTPASGLTSIAEARRTIDAHTSVDRIHREKAEIEAARLRAETNTVRARMCQEIADALEQAAGNENLEKSRYRREGICIAARLVRAAGAREQRVADSQAARLSKEDP